MADVVVRVHDRPIQKVPEPRVGECSDCRARKVLTHTLNEVWPVCRDCYEQARREVGL